MVNTHALRVILNGTVISANICDVIKQNELELANTDFQNKTNNFFVSSCFCNPSRGPYL